MAFLLLKSGLERVFKSPGRPVQDGHAPPEVPTSDLTASTSGMNVAVYSDVVKHRLDLGSTSQEETIMAHVNVEPGSVDPSPMDHEYVRVEQMKNDAQSETVSRYGGEDPLTKECETNNEREILLLNAAKVEGTMQEVSQYKRIALDRETELRNAQMEISTAKKNHEALSAKMLEFQKEIRTKVELLKGANSTVHKLTLQNTKLQETIDKMQRQLSRELSGVEGSFQDGLPNPYVLESAVQDVFSSIATFSKLLSFYKSSEKIPHAETLRTYFSDELRSTYLSRLRHKEFQLRSFIFHVLFQDFERETLSWQTESLYLNSEERVRAFREYVHIENRFMNGSISGGYCENEVDTRFYAFYQTYLTIQSKLLMPKEILMHNVTASFNRWGTPNTPEIAADAEQEESRKLCSSFIVAVRKVWNLHKLCLSFDPPATIFRVAKGTEFDPEFMDSLVALDEDSNFEAKVGFMVSPGFRLRKSVSKCKIYLQGLSKC